MLAQDNVRSKRGHAAVSMKGAGAGDSSWVVIQRNTFTNWVNEILRPKGDSVEDLQTDFCDGVRLVALVEELQGSPVGKKVVRNAPNQHQRLENVSIALNAISNDNVKLVNIGSEDIVNGNLKLILGLIWHLILRYHIGKTKFPPKKLMLAWLQSVVPSCRISNFSKNWNDGVALHGVIEYCQPGLCPDWQKLDRSKKVENCHNAMNIANEKFDIPLILRPEDLSSPHLDELSGMTYLSYFMKQDSPGYHATLNRVRKMLNHNVKNFTTDWNDGQLVCQLVRSVGGNIQDGHISGTNEEVLQKGLDAGKELGIEPILTAKQMSEEHEEHLGIMAYAASFHHLKKTCPPEQKLALDADLDNVYVGNPTKVQMTLTETDVPTSSIKMEVTGPDSSPPVHLQWNGDNGVATFTPTQTGHHMLTAYCENKIVNGCPKNFKVNADRSKIVCSQLDRCCVGTITEVKVNTTTAGQGDVRVEAKSPGGHVHNPPVMSRQGIYSANFTPTEVGDWNMGIFYDGEHIDGSPFTVNVFDPAQVQIYGLEGGAVGQALNFNADTSKAGIGDFRANIQHNGRSVPSRVSKGGTHNYKINFTPQGAGLYQISGFFNDVEIKGSPYTMEIVDSSMVSVTGQGLGMVPVNQFATFEVSTRGAGGGDVKVEIISPDGRDLPVQVKHKGDGTHKVSWTPTSVGDHKVSVTYADLPISGSPYAVQAYDPGNVMVSKIGQGVLGKPVSFNLDASQAGVGNLEIFVAVNGENVPNYVKPSGGEAQFQVSFTPHKPENHLVHVKFNGDPVLGSPFICRILNSDRVIVSGDGLHMATANVLSSFKVDPQGAEGDLNVQVTAPNGRIIPARITGSPASSYCADFTPLETGRHKISVEYADVEVKGSPFYCDVYDPSLVQVKSVGRAYMNRTVIVEVDTSAAGNGHLEAEVKCRGSVVRSNMRDLGNSKYEVSYVPRDVSMHTMSLLFNGYPLQGSPLHMDVVDSSSVSASGEGLRSAQVYRAATFDVDTHGIQDDLEVRVMSPSNSELPCNIIRRGVVNRVEFTPREVGTHTIDAAIAGAPISGSPFYCSAYDPNLVRITDIDQSGKIEREIAFTVDASAAGQGELDASVMHYGHAIRTKRESLGNSHYCYMFTPAEIGQYEVDVWFNNEKIPGCPVIVQVEEEVPTFITINFRGIRYINARNLNWFLLELDGKKIDMNELQIIVRAPNGEQIPASLIPQHDGDYKVEWTPTVPGRYTIDVLFGNRQIQGSPFNVDVFDITKVTVENLKSGNVGEAASFEIDYSNAGKAECLLRVISPTGKSVPFETREGYNRQIVTYFPTESGLHKIYATYGGTDIPGSPTTQDISDGGMPTAHGDGLYKGEEDKPAAFFVDARGLKGDLSVQVDGPNSIAKCNVDPETDGTYTVTYIPVEVGMYNAVVKWKGREIQGSPFHPKIVDARKVRVVGGWQHFMDSNDRVHLIVNEEKQIPFDVSEAGPGKLTAEVKGPNHAKVPVTIDTMSDGKNYLLFTPREEGNHHIYVYWMDHQLVGAPYLGYAVSQRPLFSNDHNKVVLSGRGLKEAVIREEAEFLIDGSEAGPGRPEVRLTGVKTDINVRIVPQDQSRYHCTYLPIFPGAYLLNITWNDRQLRGSPYKVNVIGAAQPNKVMISGEGLKGGLLGKDLHMNIDTRKAGPGELSAHCMGPTETAYCDLEDNRDGTYRLLVQPTEAGRHILQIKFGGEHIFNSPYMLTITARPDASKVRVSGSGVEHGILATFQSKFLVETRGAGAGQLTVRIKGPKGAFQVEMFRDSQKDRVILCRYNPYETGLYVIHIKWSGVDVPGSPFHVHIVDTQQEYERIMQEPSMYGGYSETIPSQLSYNQWKEDI